MRLDAQSIKLLLVITPGFGRVIGDEEDAFLCKKNEKDRIESESVSEARGAIGTGMSTNSSQAETCTLLRTLAA
jgi:hypothetical protein